MGEIQASRRVPKVLSSSREGNQATYQEQVPPNDQRFEFEYPVELELINKKVLDYRPIPSHANGKQFPKPFIKWYLEKRVNEWLAAGGYVEWKTNFQFFIRFSEHPIAGGRLFLKAFYWDL
jgi:hypothetical protein